ncbi:leucyl aminopeptidase [Buchnera aphidicola (Pemphigus obesinymphae)]|uniref:leucyl aminopeptidase n=1 Tax=Buchnera aphidicola TaxID=9 RepID=UPI002238550F|nr:leucyl aminopeptidase [Buchnera aphidicola]MCW5196592.1 leucyl aminopeptidase [Buchnera aphidicola (Pemphigus obesinymphae)]
MKFHINYLSIEKLKNECLVVGVFEDKKLPFSTKQLDEISQGYINKFIMSGEINGRINQSLLLYHIPYVFSERILLIGCGKESEFDERNYRKVIFNSIKILKNTSATEAVFFLNDLYVKDRNIYWKIRVAVEVIDSALYDFSILKSGQRKENVVLYNIFFNIYKKSEIISGEVAIKHGFIINQGIKIAKDLANLPPNICTPNYFELQSQNLVKKNNKKILIEIIDEITLKNLGMNAYLYVGKGSKNKPCMSVIKYNGSYDKTSKPIVLIGKGVTFDSGGISIKPSRLMDEMKYDMSGASVVYGLMHIVSQLKLPLNIVGILACCENMPGGNAYRPGDIVTTMSKKTVEILDTDAEGRLILCDVLTYVERFNPSIVIDVATLTGACVVALGHYVSGLFSNDDLLANDMIYAGELTNDKVWRLPIFHEYYSDLDSNFADIANIGCRSAGAITAACFLSNFTKKYTWAHIDIAGTSWKSGKEKGSTGRPILLLSQFLLNKSGLNLHN